jgi:phenylpropionate dioxygenase-like ring-hydroxylating dioxygenase large terminal subunit
MRSAKGFDQLVDLDHGTIARTIFNDESLYREEQHKLFTRAWLMVGHESLIPKPGDYFLSRMGEESVILCRDKKGIVHVFLNSCRHKGMKVCRYEQGNTPAFTCPYHRWTFATDGKLQAVPQYKELYEGHMNPDDWSLVEVAKLVIYKSSIWATWDRDAPEFLDYLGGARAHLDEVLNCRDGREGGSECIGVHKWIFGSNWKFPAENFAGDMYHAVSHQSVEMVGIGPSAQAGVKERRDDELLNARLLYVSSPEGHGIISGLLPEHSQHKPTFQGNPEVQAYAERCHLERKRRLGDKARLVGLTGNIFPNTSYHARQPRSLVVWHPHSPTQTEAWRFFLVDADAPPAVKDMLRRYYMRYSGPAGMTEQDDMENWYYATEATKGAIASRHPFCYQQSLGVYASDDPVPGNISPQVTEEMARGFYRAWASYMKDEDWQHLLGRHLPKKRVAAAPAKA